MKEYKLLRIATALAVLLILFDPVEKLMAQGVAMNDLKGRDVAEHHIRCSLHSGQLK
jgi:hypothetical protein